MFHHISSIAEFSDYKQLWIKKERHNNRKRDKAKRNREAERERKKEDRKI
jgi:hypothetical protein